MKIRKFNEDLDNESILEYIKDCFVDFIDSGAKVKEYIHNEYMIGRNVISINIKKPETKFSNHRDDSSNIIFKSVREFNDIMDNIETCLVIIRSRFTKNELTIDISVSNNYIELNFTPKV